ncbi:MAG: Ldh family oxidoreductase [Pseudoclavibacter sp.]
MSQPSTPGDDATPAAQTVPVGELVERAADFLCAHGSSRRTARIQAQHLVEAELRGHPSHGLRRLRVLAGRLDRGLIRPDAGPVLHWVSDVVLRVDGALGFGPVTAYDALDALLGRASATGIAIASMRRTHHLGMLAPYLEHATARGAVALVLSSTEGLVHPWGGAGALVGTNPIGIGVPGRDGDLTLDMSTGATSAGRILDHRDRGLPLPDGWAVDARGASTTDAAAAVDGAISPFGGAKGYGLGLAFGAVIGALTSTALGDEVFGTLDSDRETTKGDVMIVCDSALVSGSASRDALGDYFDRIRASSAHGSTVTIPGDRARAERARRLADGVEIAADLIDLLEIATGDSATGGNTCSES